MKPAVGLVRGINVGPSTAVAMDDLAASFEAVGFTAVRTLLRSGNVVFELPAGSALSVDRSAAKVERELAGRSGVAARILLIPGAEFRRIAAENPLLDDGDDFSKQVVTFLGAEPMPKKVEVPDAYSIAPEVVAVGRQAIYQWCPLGVSKTRLTAAFWRQLSPAATARNWRTVLRILGELDART
ncbi:DUF1697 domain-containing protein [Diaminobutyricibacter sp. McL0608]|uniref:DUF1697 domain-containing protein n=1 Tax=Leifsonia sp. McL0608 TaxID=3143537 RepID=UPI0031F300C6